MKTRITSFIFLLFAIKIMLLVSFYGGNKNISYGNIYFNQDFNSQKIVKNLSYYKIDKNLSTLLVDDILKINPSFVVNAKPKDDIFSSEDVELYYSDYVNIFLNEKSKVIGVIFYIKNVDGYYVDILNSLNKNSNFLGMEKADGDLNQYMLSYNHKKYDNIKIKAFVNTKEKLKDDKNIKVKNIDSLYVLVMEESLINDKKYDEPFK